MIDVRVNDLTGEAFVKPPPEPVHRRAAKPIWEIRTEEQEYAFLPEVTSPRLNRYGQKIDVTVVNFINDKNQAERRIFQLLDQKFRLFDGVFGASDEVLGAIESGVDFERRVLEMPEVVRFALKSLERVVEAARSGDGAGGSGSVISASPVRRRWSWAWVNSSACWSPVSVIW